MSKRNFNYNHESGNWTNKCHCVNKPTICKKIQESLPHLTNCHCPCPSFDRSQIRHLISVKNPESILNIPELELLNQFQANAIIGNAVDLALWSDLITDESGLFDETTGIYTVPETGDYQIQLTLSYETSVPLHPDFFMDNVPFIEIYDINTTERILASQFVVNQFVVSIPPQSSGELPVDVTVTSIVNRSQIIINAIVSLEIGQKIRFRAVTNGLVYIPPLIVPDLPTPPFISFYGANADTTLAIYQIRNNEL